MKNDHTFNNKLLIILKLYVHYLHYFLDLSIKSKMEKRGFIHTKIKNTDGWKEKRKLEFFFQLFHFRNC